MSTNSEPQINVDSQLMENYRIATAVTGGSDMLAIRNGGGDVELFTVGNDGTVWNFYPDESSDTGYPQVALPFQSAATTRTAISTSSPPADCSSRIAARRPTPHRDGARP